MYTWVTFIHIILAMFWVGGMLFTAAILVPATRKKLAPQRGLLFTELGTRFSKLSWIIFPLMLISGVLALIGKGFALNDLLRAEFWQTAYGNVLFAKLHFFGLVLILSGVHDFWLGPKAAELMETNPEAAQTKKFRKAASWAGRINLLLGVIIVFYAVSLVRW